ncbi:nucleoporin NUP116/NSP116-like [Hyalella azteca]|uniref:Nucleoporin NUP116/NSP116-like n=1 Tax=Hyalella azteca TaxID=294128 RepID=A0A979FI93_HYAAZ|nr:nucleoporin NUP116/NSP116-like [Hyalella azteca]
MNAAAQLVCKKRKFDHEYENKSLEELRVEDYLANLKSPGQGGGLMTGAFGQNTASTGLFGSTATNTGGLFGQNSTETKPLFGSSNTGFAAPSSSGGLFGSSTIIPSFGQTRGSSAESFAFGQNTQQNKPAALSVQTNGGGTWARWEAAVYRLLWPAVSSEHGEGYLMTPSG